MPATSPFHEAGQFGPVPALEQKIDLFQARVLGWQIDVAEEMSRLYFAARVGGRVRGPMGHCGFAILGVLSSYFEAIAQYLRGERSSYQSKSFFVEGFRDVFPALSLTESDIQAIYREVRNGLYHNGITRKSVNISEDHQPTFRVDEDGIVLLNPFTLVTEIKAHFLGYVNRLRDGSQSDLRRRFEATFDWQGTSLDYSYLMGSGSGW